MDFRATIDSAAERLAAISEERSMQPYGPGKWLRKEVLGHLIDSAANNHQRFVRAQLQGELSFPGYQQNGWVDVQAYRDEPWADLVDLWRSYNLHLLHLMSRVPEELLLTVCTIGTNEPVTLGYLMEDYVVHMKHHLEQILDL